MRFSSPCTGVGDSGGFGLTVSRGVGVGVAVGVGVGVYLSFGVGVGPGPSARTALALSRHKIATLIHTADLWVEYVFMGGLLSSLAYQPKHSFYLKCFCRRNCFHASVIFDVTDEIFSPLAAYRVTTTHQRACPDHVNWARFGGDNQKTRHPPFQSHQKKNRIAN